MDDATAGPRIKQLRHELAQLQARRDDLADTLDRQPEQLPPGTLDRLRAYLAHTIAAGTSGERKRAIEALIHEIRITDQGIIPVFKIPSGEPTTPGTSGSRNGAVGGAGGTRTRDRGIMSPLL